jgi:hypothetical protein
MSQNIADFYRSIQQNDFARQFQFRVVQLANTNFGEDSLIYLETANLPGSITAIPPGLGRKVRQTWIRSRTGNCFWSSCHRAAATIFASFRAIPSMSMRRPITFCASMVDALVLCSHTKHF